MPRPIRAAARARDDACPVRSNARASQSRPSARWLRWFHRRYNAPAIRRPVAASSPISAQANAARMFARSRSSWTSESFPMPPSASNASATTRKWAACRERVAASSPLTASCSSPNSRTVSSIPYREAPSSRPPPDVSACPMRLWSTSDPSPARTSIPGSSAAARTAAAASRVNPPTKTDRRRKSIRSSYESRS